MASSEGIKKTEALLNRAIEYYGILVLTVFSLFLIAPFVTLVSGTAFSHLQTYCGLLGGLLLLWDLLVSRGCFRGKYVWLLFAIVLLAGISSLLTREYGIKDNLFKLAWTVIQFGLLYSLSERSGGTLVTGMFQKTYALVAVIWGIACAVSLYQYLFGIGYTYVVDASLDTSVTRQGFWGARLFGVFSPLNHAAYVSLFILLSGIVYFKKTKKLWLRLPIAVSMLVSLLHIILSGSRSALVSMTFSLFFITLSCVKNISFRRIQTRLAAFLAALVVCGLVCVGFPYFKQVLADIPAFVNAVQEYDEREHGQNSDETPAFDPDIFDMEDGNILEREEIKGNVSNDRFRIWTDYLSLYKEIGPIGLSPGNYQLYIRDHSPDLYIVQYVRDNFPGKYETGLIYHVHNGYLMVYVSAGIIGAALLLAFLLLAAVKILRGYFSRQALPFEIIIALAIVASGLISAVFDKGIFLENSAHSLAFWPVLGYVLSYFSHRATPTEMN